MLVCLIYWPEQTKIITSTITSLGVVIGLYLAIYGTPEFRSNVKSERTKLDQDAFKLLVDRIKGDVKNKDIDEFEHEVYKNPLISHIKHDKYNKIIKLARKYNNSNPDKKTFDDIRTGLVDIEKNKSIADQAIKESEAILRVSEFVNFSGKEIIRFESTDQFSEIFSKIVIYTKLSHEEAKDKVSNFLLKSPHVKLGDYTVMDTYHLCDILIKSDTEIKATFCIKNGRPKTMELSLDEPRYF